MYRRFPPSHNSSLDTRIDKDVAARERLTNGVCSLEDTPSLSTQSSIASVPSVHPASAVLCRDDVDAGATGTSQQRQ